MKTKNIYFSDKEEFKTVMVGGGFLNSKSVLIQIFSSLTHKENLKSIISDIKDVIPHAKIIGATTDGEILENNVTTDKVLVSVSSFENSTLTIAMQENSNDSFICGKELATKLLTDKTKVLILFSEGLHTNGEFFLDGVQSVNSDVLVAGGMAGDGASFEKTYVFCDDEIISDGAVGVAIDSDILKVKSAYSFNWQEIGKPLVITKAKDNRVYEIDNTTALDIYARYLGNDIAELLPATGIEFPLIINRDGMKIARAVLGKEKDGSLFFAGNLNEGDEVYFGFGNSDRILSESIKTRDSFKYTPIESIFIYSCMARRRFLLGDIKAELTPLSSLAPTSGFFTYGEFFKSKKCELLNQTMTILTLSEDRRAIKRELQDTKTSEDFINFSTTYKALTHLIEETSRELKETNDNLERLVEIKTAELQNKVQELKEASKVKSEFGKYVTRDQDTSKCYTWFCRNFKI
jgi:hypothetical protein